MTKWPWIGLGSTDISRSESLNRVQGSSLIADERRKDVSGRCSGCPKREESRERGYSLVRNVCSLVECGQKPISTLHRKRLNTECSGATSVIVYDKKYFCLLFPPDRHGRYVQRTPLTDEMMRVMNYEISSGRRLGRHLRTGPSRYDTTLAGDFSSDDG